MKGHSFQIIGQASFYLLEHTVNTVLCRLCYKHFKCFAKTLMKMSTLLATFRWAIGSPAVMSSDGPATTVFTSSPWQAMPNQNIENSGFYYELSAYSYIWGRQLFINKGQLYFLRLHIYYMEFSIAVLRSSKAVYYRVRYIWSSSRRHKSQRPGDLMK